MTEEEAKTKWCPFSRCFDKGHQVAGYNRCEDGLVPLPTGSFCMGAACMAWKFDEQIFNRPTELWSKSRNKKVCSAYSDDAEWRPVTGKSDDEPPLPHGYCSLMNN